MIYNISFFIRFQHFFCIKNNFIIFIILIFVIKILIFLLFFIFLNTFHKILKTFSVGVRNIHGRNIFIDIIKRG
jgi:hypothetical protein